MDRVGDQQQMELFKERTWPEFKVGHLFHVVLNFNRFVGKINIHFREPLTFKLKLNRVMGYPTQLLYTTNEMKNVIELDLCTLNKAMTVKVPHFTSKNFYQSTQAVAIQDQWFCHS
nr:PREDICTED: uncharacterized protein LOC108203786 [Daucus carota subsp. sativus]